MTPYPAAPSPQIHPRIAGWMYLIGSAFAAFSIQYVPSVLVVSGDVVTTTKHILASEALVRLSIASDLIGQIIFIVLVLVLYQLLKPVDTTMSRLMVIFWVVGVPIDLLNHLNLFAILFLLHSSAGLTADQVHALVPLLLNVRANGITLAEIFSGLWLVPLGYLVFTSGFLPRIIGVLLIVAGIGYVAQSGVDLLFPNSGVIIYLFTGWGELVFALWLVIRGVNVAQWEKRTYTSPMAP